MQDWLVSLEDVLAGVPDPSVGKPVNYPIQHGTMRVGIYAPRGTDPQQPHDQDEIYIVIAGTGTFVKAGERRPFKPGDVIFVEAGIEHRFEDFADDFATWVVFWGREGGEAEARSAAE
ncbi:MAG: cupin domain-containing protein [Alphaproteobacteria bacterium]|nr:cupin domain-containing protein [Alphaproteobacteria bacterium]